MMANFLFSKKVYHSTSDFFFGKNWQLKKFPTNVVEGTFWKFSPKLAIFQGNFMKSPRLLEDLGKFIAFFF
jgi:hypothetical protein